jgi:hypothetical protein
MSSRLRPNASVSTGQVVMQGHRWSVLCLAEVRQNLEPTRQGNLSYLDDRIGRSVQWCSREFGLQTISNHSTAYWGQKYMYATPVLTSVLLCDD